MRNKKLNCNSLTQVKHSSTLICNVSELSPEDVDRAMTRLPNKL